MDQDKFRNTVEKLIERGITVVFPCGGKGICKKCEVTVVRNGKREKVLLCQLSTDEIDELEIEHIKPITESKPPMPEVYFQIDHPFGKTNLTAVDLGSTNIYILNLEDNKHTISHISNPQIAYGHDIISRCEPSLSRRMRDLLIKAILNKATGHVVSISGNTVMQNLLTGEDLTGLIKFPFSLGKKTFRTLSIDGKKLVILPEIGGFLGGDAISLALITSTKEKPAIGIDIGTNTEIILVDENSKVYATSTPSGSAIEGGKIKSCMLPLDGTVWRVDENFSIDIIGKGIPIGFTASGFISAVFALYRRGLIDESGKLLVGNYITIGGIKIDQEDIRELQLIKAGIFSAIKALIKQSGIKTVKSVVIAGNLGLKIEKEWLVNLKFVPEELAEAKFFYQGNVSLWGAKWVLLSRKVQEEMEKIVESAIPIRLGDLTEYETLFMEGMNF